MQDDSTPTLFGIKNTNRDFSKIEDWGKNVFNNAFPASLVAYMHSKGVEPVYLTLGQDLKVKHSKINVKDFFGIDPLSEKTFYDFESLYIPYEPLVSSILPRIDLVICSLNDDGTIEKCLKGIEIKLTALPDHSTAESDESEYGSEIVVRPDTIVYLALSIATNYFQDREKLGEIILPVSGSIENWNDKDEMVSKIDEIRSVLNNVLLDSLDKQEPLVLQPIWKTVGKSLELQSNSFDAFVWSDYGFTRLFVDNVRGTNGSRVTRQMRSCVWLLKMLHDFVTDGKVDHSSTIRNINFGSQTDKAFAANGRITRNYLKSDELLRPRIKDSELRNIILNEGQKMLSPERRFDAAVLGNASLFEQ